MQVNIMSAETVTYKAEEHSFDTFIHVRQPMISIATLVVQHFRPQPPLTFHNYPNPVKPNCHIIRLRPYYL